jgi:hypothetical protein
LKLGNYGDEGIISISSALKVNSTLGTLIVAGILMSRGVMLHNRFENYRKRSKSNWRSS